MSLLQDFKHFAMRGNVIDLAVGVVIGTAFGKITSSLVDNIIMPPIGVLISGVDFSRIGITLAPARDGAPAVIWGFGAFVQTCFNFMIIALAVFMLVRLVNRLFPKEPPPADAPSAPPLTKDQQLLMEIRDALGAQAKANGQTPLPKKG